MKSKGSATQYVMVELKAKVDDLAPIRNKLTQYGANHIGIYHQYDIYYQVPKGRLKLRITENESTGELIYYEREDVARAKTSFDYILKIPHPHAVKEIFEKIMKTKTVVEKIREIYQYENVQVHLDKVKSLGSFVEFECITSQNLRQQKKDHSRLEKLGEKLDVRCNRLESLSYSDLISE